MALAALQWREAAGSLSVSPGRMEPRRSGDGSGMNIARAEPVVADDLLEIRAGD
jgi:hypothetical protein